MPLIFIYAGEKRQAEWLGEWLGLEHSSWEFLSEERGLNGIHNPKVILWGTYRNRRDYHYTLDMLAAVEAFVIEVNDDMMRFRHRG